MVGVTSRWVRISLVSLWLFPQAARSETVAEQLLQLSIECPAPLHDVNEGQNYALKVMDRNHWEGDSAAFRVRTDTHELLGTIRGPETVDDEYIITAKFSDIDSNVSVSGDDVTISCKNGSACFTYSAPPGKVSQTYAEPYHSDKAGFVTCDGRTADNLRRAINSIASLPANSQ